MELNKLQVTGDSQGDWHRTIVSLRVGVKIFARLVDNPDEEAILIAHEVATKPYLDEQPIITRVFEEAELFDPIAEAINWPFEHPSRSRYSTGNFGVWYGADSLLTSIHETVHHFRIDTLASDAVVPGSIVIQERRVHLVHCAAALVDLRPHVALEPHLLDPDDYSACQALGLQIFNAALPGIINRSVRYPAGVVVGVFRRDSLTGPRTVCYLTYRLDVDSGRVRVERDPGHTMVEIGV